MSSHYSPPRLTTPSPAYGRYIANVSLPVVNVGSRVNPTYLPAEVCEVLPGQPAKAKLDPSQTQQMIQFAVRRPHENMKSIIQEGLVDVGLSATTNRLLGPFGMTRPAGLITVPGRVLVSPTVIYRQNKPASVFGGSWNMMSRGGTPPFKFNTGGAVELWSCLYINMPDSYPRAQSFTPDGLKYLLAQFATILGDAGMTVKPPLPARAVNLSGPNDIQLDDFLKRAAGSLQLLLVILPSTSMPEYNRIKQLGDVKYGIRTVCCVGSKLAKEKGQDQYIRNVALKCNLKLGGRNHGVDPKGLGLVAEGKTMVVGIDVTHPSPGSASTAPSVASMVASVDSFLGQWPGVLSIQAEARQEMVAHLRDMLISRLRLWQKRGGQGKLPENILVYRDGVSEGQYSLVIDQELPLLRAACKAVYPPADQAKGLPHITLVVVGKRHHTRFYPTTEDGADRGGNTKPGTVVDRGVTEARTWDFFLQAHAALQGTVRPGHYVVLLDEIFRPKYDPKGVGGPQGGMNVADRLQDITQSMCYVFGRATKAVSLCTPAYYADILCERARCYLSHVFDETPAGSTTGSTTGAQVLEQDVLIHPNLKDTMFYI